jgi:hypothetical protein
MSVGPASQPSPPPPPAAEALARENAALAAELANDALRSAAQAGRAERGAAPSMGVVRNPDGRIIVTGRDGRTVVIDPKVGLEDDAVEEMVQTALAPPSVPDPRPRGPSDAVQIVGIVMATLLLLLLGFPLVRGYLRRSAAGASPAGPSPELAGRLARIEQAIEAVAIEVERIAESERYSARLLTERLPERPAERQGEVLRAAAGPPTADVVR